MADFGDLDKVIDRYHAALDAFFTGDPEPTKAAFSHRDDVSLANPLGPPAVGWRQVAETSNRNVGLGSRPRVVVPSRTFESRLLR